MFTSRHTVEARHDREDMQMRAQAEGEVNPLHMINPLGSSPQRARFFEEQRGILHAFSTYLSFILCLLQWNLVSSRPSVCRHHIAMDDSHRNVVP
jgi:hypothetical protein